jgi:uncharacterized protein
MLAAALAGACTSGPGPIDDRPYEQQVLADRAAKDTAFRTNADEDSPIPADQRATFPGLSYYPIDPAFRVPAFLTEDRSGPPVVIELQTTKAERQPMRKVGTLGFTIGGAAYSLTAFADEGDAAMNHLFVPFRDLTNGTETYQGGRYLNLTRTPTGLYDLDFNRAYQPYCVYNHEYICPVPPRENRLPVAIRAGEKLATPAEPGG